MSTKSNNQTASVKVTPETPALETPVVTPEAVETETATVRAHKAVLATLLQNLASRSLGKKDRNHVRLAGTLHALLRAKTSTRLVETVAEFNRATIESDPALYENCKRLECFAGCFGKTGIDPTEAETKAVIEERKAAIEYIMSTLPSFTEDKDSEFPIADQVDMFRLARLRVSQVLWGISTQTVATDAMQLADRIFGRTKVSATTDDKTLVRFSRVVNNRLDNVSADSKTALTKAIQSARSDVRAAVAGEETVKRASANMATLRKSLSEARKASK